MAAHRQPRLILQLSARRRPYFWRVLRALVVLAFLLLGIYTLDEAVRLERIPAAFWLPGIILFTVFAVIFALRAAINFWRWLRQRNETVRFFDRGFIWAVDGQKHQYGWSAVQNFREGGRAHVLTMNDGRIFRVTRAFGELPAILKVLRRPTAHVTGIQIGQALREEKSVQIHRNLVMWPGGLEVNQQEIPWSEVEVKLDGNTLNILRKTSSGKFAPVRRFRASSLNNLGGFLEVARATIRNHQRERFGV
jgi:hypothetical protein